MKLNNNFRMSIISANLTSELADSVSVAINVARLGMAVQYDADKIASLEKKIEKLEDAESLSESQKLELQKARLDLEDLKAEKSALEAERAEWEKVYESVVTSMVAEGNTESNVRTMLNVVALDGNQFLSKYALESDTFKDEIVGALTKIAEGTRWNASTGAPVLNKDEREVYKSALKSLKGMIRQEFSLTHDSAYTKRTMVNASAEELGLLVQTFVKDFTVKRVKSDDGVYSVKYEKTLRDWTSLRAQIVKIVLKRTMRAC